MSTEAHDGDGRAATSAEGPVDGQNAATYLKERRRSLLGAVFLMTMSAIGPGFITQTATYTVKLGAAFAFGILLSIIIDFVAQMNVWRVIGLSGRTAGELANAAIPGTGYVLAAFVIFGGLVFNVGNIAGTGLGLNAVFGLDPKIGGLISALLAIVIFTVKRAGAIMDRVVIALAAITVLMIVVVLFVVHPPVGTALKETVLPSTVDFAAITTIVGGTVGGYITYAGAHRLLDSGLVGTEHEKAITQASFWGIAATGVIRYLLFLAILGVAASGVTIDLASQTANPAAQAFQIALGDWGYRIFGVLFWAAGLSSVIGAAYTSVSFFGTFSKLFTRPRVRHTTTIVFIAVSLVIYLLMGTAPAALLVFAGGFNGLILPLGLTILIFIGFSRRDLLGGRRIPMWLLVSGTLVCALTWWMAVSSVKPIFALLGA